MILPDTSLIRTSHVQTTLTAMSRATGTENSAVLCKVYLGEMKCVSPK